MVQAACTDPLVPAQRKRLVDLVESSGIARDGNRWLKRVEAETLAAIAELGESTAVELTKAVPDLGRQMAFGEDKKWGGNVGVSTRLLFLLSTEQRVVRARPKGSWTSSQHRWASMDTRFPDGIPKLKPAEARADLVQRWLATYGPATTADVKWWTGWRLGQTRTALAEVGAVEVELEVGPGWVLPDDEAHGRIVGGWAQRATGEVIYELLEDVDRTAKTAITRRGSEPCGSSPGSRLPYRSSWKAEAERVHHALMTCSRSNALHVESAGYSDGSIGCCTAATVGPTRSPISRSAARSNR